MSLAEFVRVFAPYQAFTANMSQALVQEGVVVAGATLKEVSDSLLQTRETLSRLMKAGEGRSQAMLRLHEAATAGLKGGQIPPYLNESAAVIANPEEFRNFLSDFRAQTADFVLIPLVHVQHQEVLIRFCRKFAPLLERTYEGYELLHHFLEPFQYKKQNHKKIRGREEEFTADFYLTLSAAALYDPDTIRSELTSKADESEFADGDSDDSYDLD